MQGSWASCLHNSVRTTFPLNLAVDEALPTALAFSSATLHDINLVRQNCLFLWLFVFHRHIVDSFKQIHRSLDQMLAAEVKDVVM